MTGTPGGIDSSRQVSIDRRLLESARPGRHLLALAILLAAAAGALAVFQARYFSQVVSQVSLQGQSLEDVAQGLVLLMLVILTRAALVWGSDLASHRTAEQVKTNMRTRLLRHLLALGPAYAREARTGELVNAATEGIEALEPYFSQYLPQAALAVLVPVTLLAFVFPLDPLSGIVLLLTAPLMPLFMYLIGSAAHAQTRKQWRSLERMSAYFLDVIQGLTTLKLLGRSRQQAQQIARVSQRYAHETLSVQRITFLSALALELIAALSTAVVAVEVGLRLLHGQMGFEQALFVLVLAPEFYQPLRSLSLRFHAGIAGRTAAVRLFAILDTPLPVHAHNSPPRPNLHLPPEITFDHINFTYPDGRQALRNLSFTMPAGTLTALVGPSGAGKSTAAALLLGFIQAQQGQIRINGFPLSSLPLPEWLTQVAWVPQKPYLFHGTLLENIRLARPSATLAEVQAAAQLADADGFIQAFPQGYQTPIGERAARLSGGQAQRIALARAFLKDAPLLILDEATQALDPETETAVQQALARLRKGRTALVIAHRKGTLQLADQVVLLDRGNLIATGSSEQVLAHHLLSHDFTPSQPALQAIPATSYRLPPSRPILPDADFITSGLKTAAPALKRLLRLLSPYKTDVFLSVLLGFAAIASSVGLLATSAFIISSAAFHPSIAILQVPIVGVRFFGLARGIFRYLERLSAHRTTFQLLARLRVWFYQALEPLAPARLLSQRSGDLLSRITTDIGALESFYVRSVAPPLIALVTALTVPLFLGSFHPVFSALWLAAFLIAGFVLPLVIHRLSQQPGKELTLLRAGLTTAIVDTVQGLADLLVYGQGLPTIDSLVRLDHEYSLAQRRLARLQALQNALLSLFAHLALWSILAAAIPLVGRGQVSGVALAALALAALSGFEAALPLPQAAQYLEHHLTTARRLFEIVDTTPEVSAPVSPQLLPETFDLTVKALSFQYPAEAGQTQSAPLVLADMTFQLPLGKKIAVVGPSGSGKSTLVQILLRFWDYHSGQILLAGNDLRRYCPEELRRQIAVVPQNPYLFSASLRDNLLMAHPDASEADIYRAIHAAQITALLPALPEGIHTWIGEQGVRLSGGERQRVALARALLKDTPLLILDEPTAHLDPATENSVMSGILHFVAGRSLLLATHRLVGMEAMDEILVLAQGKVVERGRHAELVHANGFYARLWALQNQEFDALGLRES